MSRSPLRRVLASLRRIVRRRRVPGASEQEWLRLILLVRRLQQGQLASMQRLDQMRGPIGALGSLRSDVGTLRAQLESARGSASELDRGLAERLGRMRTLPQPGEEYAALDKRVAELGDLARRLERLAAQAPGAPAAMAELTAGLTRLGELATRFENVQQSERSSGAQDELAKIYERIGELAENLARGPRSGAQGEPVAPTADSDGHLAQKLERLEAAVQALAPKADNTQLDQRLARLERLAERLAERTESAAVDPRTADELAGALLRFESLAQRLEQAPALLPELPAETLSDDPRLLASGKELEELRAALHGTQENQRRAAAELEALRGQLRSSELARIELETRHASELTQVADHAQRQLQRLEDDIKKKKRGLAELTQRNIQLQVALRQHESRAAGGETPAVDPSAPLPRKGSLTSLMRRDALGEEKSGE